MDMLELVEPFAIKPSLGFAHITCAVNMGQDCPGDAGDVPSAGFDIISDRAALQPAYPESHPAQELRRSLLYIYCRITALELSRDIQNSSPALSIDFAPRNSLGIQTCRLCPDRSLMTAAYRQDKYMLQEPSDREIIKHDRAHHRNFKNHSRHHDSDGKSRIKKFFKKSTSSQQTAPDSGSDIHSELPFNSPISFLSKPPRAGRQLALIFKLCQDRKASSHHDHRAL
ncbi:hypothetical protein PCANC_25650 [Puccinia coronata f. sp. avenae]|uniref:Uncharacterized protein n=1 Tax=Puccinia coronata f. sp. avenae TaxID=200324 RepID=A0A2N5S125_9BASI|nr:hypothetical protein PCANC_25650 [Puccinia coronata f. sp. avenae]